MHADENGNPPAQLVSKLLTWMDGVLRNAAMENKDMVAAAGGAGSTQAAEVEQGAYPLQAVVVDSTPAMQFQ